MPFLATVVWAQVAQRSYDDSELNWTFLSFMSLATLIAGIAIVLDSQILVIGAMVLGPEFGAIAALDAPVVVAARNAAHRWRELYVAAPVGERVRPRVSASSGARPWRWGSGRRSG